MAAKNLRCGLRFITTSVESNPISNTKIRAFEDIPGPRPLPIVGNLWRYIIGQYDYKKLHKTYQKMHGQYGSVIKEKLFGQRTLVHVFDPKDMRTVYETSGSRPVRMSHRALQKYRRQRPHLYSCGGLFPSNGEEWYRFRKLFQKLLLSPPTVDACSDTLETVTDQMVNKIPSQLDANNEMDLQPLLFNWALECIGAITLNRLLGCLSADGNKEAESLIKAANDTHYAIYLTENTPFSISSFKKLEAAQDLLSGVVEKYLDKAIEDFQNGKNTDSIVGKMLELEGADRKDIFTMILDMFMAGIDTTAFTLSFGLYNLANNRDIQDKLREEVMRNLPTKDTRFIDTSLDQYPYLKAVVNETLRVNPVAIGTGRIIQTDLVLGGYRVPAQTNVILQHQVASMQEKYFPNPGQFNPERWLRREFVPLVSSPFGYGARVCVGKKLALRELYLAFTKMVRRFDISYHYEDIDSTNRLINVPDKPLRLRLKDLQD